MSATDGGWIYKNRYWVGGAIAVTIIGVVLYINRKKVTEIGGKIVEGMQNKVWDAISEQKIEKLHPLVKEKARELINKAEAEGIKLRVTDTLRTWAEQDEKYAQGRTKAGSIVTNAKGGQSNHNFGLAMDVVEIVNGKAVWDSKNWDKIGKIGKSVGFFWGGDFKSITDKPHFEMTFGKTLAQLQTLYSSGQRDGEYVKLIA